MKKNKETPRSEDLRKLAADLREQAKAEEQVKMVKCAKYVLGMTALKQLEKKIRSL